ncbi:MAG: hypothetical protein RML12_06155 [Xanthomonadales bacterium]|nr:hypothetical protein [Xanthomonadales bacterium]
MNAPAQSCATSFLRPVYLCPREPLEVRLGPGPSLELHHGRHAPGLLPLARLARILANRHVRWQTEALYACLEHGIPIVFVDRDRVLGWSFGEDARRYRLDELLEFALDRDDWEHVLGDFFRAHQRRAMIAAARALGVLADRFEPVHLRGLLANRLRDRLGRPVGSLLRQAELAPRLGRRRPSRRAGASGPPPRP